MFLPCFKYKQTTQENKDILKCTNNIYLVFLLERDAEADWKMMLSFGSKQRISCEQ